MTKILLAIPTLNEADNVKLLHKRIRKFNKKINILFVDDNSQDGTQKNIKDIIKIDNKTKLIIRKNAIGIGSAHKFCFRYAYKNRYDFLITMDADFSHDPKLINKMIKLKDKFHLIQTNRFKNKNSLNDWPIYRIILTNLRFFLLNLLLNIKYDSSGAFRCYNLNKIKLNLLVKANHNGYSFFWESMYYFCKNNFTIKELSGIQKYRKKGTSKLSIKEWVGGLIYLLYFYLSELIK